MRRLSLLLSVVIVICCLGSAVFAAGTITDTLTRETTGVASGSTTYTDWEATGLSGTVYKGQSAGKFGSIQMRSDNSNSGIVTTKSVGYARKITVSWNSNNNTLSGQKLKIYGKHSAYSSPEDLFSSDSATCGDSLGYIGVGSSTPLSIAGNYEYIGIRSSSGALYLDSVKIDWETGGSSCMISFDVGIAKDSMDSVVVDAGTLYELPDWEFDIPEGKFFAGWRIGDKDYNAGDEVEVNSSITVTAIWEDEPVLEGTVDTLYASNIGVPTTSYESWYGLTDNSDAIYEGITSKDHNAVQFNSKRISGIVTSSSGGRILQVIVEWNEYTSSGRVLDIYGKNTPYEQSSDLYSTDEEICGELLGTIKRGQQTSLVISGEYKYIGVRSHSGAICLDNINFVWDDSYPHTITPKCKVSFDPGEGEGSMGDVYVRPGTDYELPGIEFDDPEDKVFDGWKIGGSDTVLSTGQKIVIMEDITLTAVYINPDYQPDIKQDGIKVQFEENVAVKFGNLPQGTVVYRAIDYGDNGSRVIIAMDVDALNRYVCGRLYEVMLEDRQSINGDCFYISLPEGYSLEGPSDAVVCEDTTIPETSSGDSTFLFSLNSDGIYTKLQSLPEQSFAYQVKYPEFCTCTYTVNARYNSAATLAGHSLSLDGNIGINFYMALSDDVRDSLNAYMLFTTPAGTSKVYVKDVKDSPRTVDGNTYYSFMCGVSAKEMNKVVMAQMYVNGEKLGDEMSFSVRDYAEYILANRDQEAYAKAAPVAVAMLNYGSAAQAYFKADTNDLANKNLDEGERTVPNVTAQDIGKPFGGAGSLPEGVTFTGASLSLKSETTLSLYFVSDAELTFECSDGYTVESAADGGYQIARIRGISADKLGSDITLSVTCAAGSGSITYCPMTYCYNVLNGSYPKVLKNVCMALYTYYQAAENYKSAG